jgi:hypothetical protein
VHLTATDWATLGGSPWWSGAGDDDLQRTGRAGGAEDLVGVEKVVEAEPVCDHARDVQLSGAEHAQQVAERFSPRTRVRGIASILGALAVALGGMWIYFAVDNAVTGNVPAGSQLVETDTIVHLGMALDLTLLVPLYAVAAVLLWRQAAWGYVLAAVALVAGVLHQVSYVVAMPLQVAANVPEAVTYDPVEPVILLLYLVATALLLRGARRASTAQTGRKS